MSMNNVTFTPKYSYGTRQLYSGKISYYLKNGDSACHSIPSSIVEIDIKNTKNMMVLEKAVESWGEKDCYGKSIIESVKNQRKSLKKSHSKIYALTLQRENLDILDWGKILGLSEVSRKGKKKIEIDFLQVKPDSAGKSTEKQFSGIGKHIVKMLQRKSENAEIIAKADYRAANFYEKMNFSICCPKQLIYVWKRLKGVRIPKH